MKRHFFFDLDGTLARTGEDIIIAWKGALVALGMDISNFDKVFSIGPTLEKVLEEMYPGQVTPELLERVMGEFKVRYDDGGFPNTMPYDGIEELIDTLKSQGAKIYIVTNKRDAPTQLIARKFGWDQSFDGIWSYDSLDVHYKKPELLKILIERLGINREECVMIGDTKGDVTSGKANDITTIGVTWGYGSASELQDADIIVNHPHEILLDFKLFSARRRA